MRPGLLWNPVIPALRWEAGRGYGLSDPRVEAALRDEAPGFILFGGTAEAAREAAGELMERAHRLLLLGADLERGAGQQFAGATPLPPPAALAALDDLEVTRAAGALTGREAVALGVPWVFAPVADLATEPDNPIVGTRSFGVDPHRVGEHVGAWIQGCLSAGALPCVKHFPGHGRTLEDSHAALPVVDASLAELQSQELIPFAAAFRAGVSSVMTAHVSYPEVDRSGRPATRSRPVVQDLLRGRLGYQGLVVSDALVMEGAGTGDEALAEALGAGVDLLLYPPEDADVVRALGITLATGQLSTGDIRRSRGRVQALLERVRWVSRTPPDAGHPGWGDEASLRLAADWAGRSLQWAPDMASAGTEDVSLAVVDDDAGGPYAAPSREPLARGLRVGGEVTVLEPGTARPGTRHLLAVFAEPRAWKGRAGLSAEARDAVGQWASATQGQPRGILLFGGSRVAADLPRDLPVLMAWGGEALMQEAVAAAVRDRDPDPRALAVHEPGAAG